MSIRDRMIAIIKHEGVSYPALERLSGIGVNTWRAFGGKKQRATEEAIEFIAKKWPQYAYWLVTGDVMVEAGQISPEPGEQSDIDETEMSGTNG